MRVFIDPLDKRFRAWLACGSAHAGFASHRFACLSILPDFGSRLFLLVPREEKFGAKGKASLAPGRNLPSMASFSHAQDSWELRLSGVWQRPFIIRLTGTFGPSLFIDNTRGPIPTHDSVKRPAFL